jgi:hypothetical protein
MSRELPRLDDITDETPLRLDVAAALAYPDGSMKESGLRAEIRAGRLDAELTAGRYYTTLGDIKRMRQACRGRRRERASGSARTTDTGISETESESAALAALKQTAEELRKPSRPTSPRSMNRASGKVIPLASRS